jgi:integrase
VTLAWTDIEVPARIRHLVDVAADLVERGTPQNTRRAYAGDFRRFQAWAGSYGLSSLPAPPETLLLYLAFLADAGKKPSTIDRAVAGIVAAHRMAGQPSPRNGQVSAFLGRIARALRSPQRRAAPLLVRHLQACIEALDADSSLPDDLRARDRAMLLLGWSGALRRSEIAALDDADVGRSPEGLRLSIRSSKGDQLGEGAVVPIAPARRPELCPVLALERWLAVRGDLAGPLFHRSFRSVLLLGERIPSWQVGAAIERILELAELVPEDAHTHFSAHSLRAGLITEAARAGARDWQIMRHSRHKSHEMISRYVRLSDPFEGNPQAGLL